MGVTFEATKLQEVADLFETRSLDAQRRSRDIKRKVKEREFAKGEEVAWRQASEFIASLKLTPTPGGPWK